MNSSPEISIIIPVYNVENYIEKCINSVKSQSFTDFECLIIDDGSPDNSIPIAKTLIQDDTRFTIYQQKNIGLGPARNTGLNYATGKYIVFIDSDDYIEKDYLFELINKIKLENADICTCDVKLVDGNGEKIKEFINQPDKYREKNDILNTQLYIANWAWNKIYKKECFENTRFASHIQTFEDVYITFQILYNRKITSVNKLLYNYVHREGSISHSLKPTLLHDRLAITQNHKNFLIKNNLFDKNKDYYDFAYLKNYIAYTIVMLARYSMDYKSDVNKLKSQIEKKQFTYKKIIKSINKDPRIGISILVFKISPSLFKLFINLIKKNKH
ncbi:glycosyltransferase family 2 protein [Providencia rettgeri]|uniref:glycosyltransferase family 2 protein n=1 Tax=Providencia rettgeri TaxID=587 RepID=UPI002361970F|nr:glycosyltransferase family 2 protein [Providencia rettgeri]